jgi:hypothetical protein
VSRTTHELNKAKHQVLLAALQLKADPENLEKRLALSDAINDLEKDRPTVQGAILKAFHGGDRAVDITALFLEASLEKSKAGGREGTTINIDSSGAAIPALKPKRLNMQYPGDQTHIFEKRKDS